MRLQGLLRWAGRGLAACSALLPFTGLIPPGGTAAWALPVRPPPGGGGGVSRFAPGLLRKRPPLCYNKNRKTERGSML